MELAMRNEKQKEEDKLALTRVMEMGFSSVNPDDMDDLETAISKICTALQIDFSEVRGLAVSRIESYLDELLGEVTP